MHSKKMENWDIPVKIILYVIDYEVILT